MRSIVLTLSLAAVGLIAVADYLTGYDVRLAILYLAPIAITTWRLGGSAGAGMALVASLAWIVSFGSSNPYSNPTLFYWEGAIIALTFLIIVTLLARLHRALERSDERFVTVLEGLDAAVHVADARSGETLYENRRFRETFGDSRAPLHESGEVFDERRGRWHLARSQPLRWTDGREATLHFLSDITEERNARELLARHREDAHRTARLVALGEFASGIAHELNQPLAAIATYNNVSLRLLEKTPLETGELAEAMRRCRDQARRAGEIIRRLREVLRQPVSAGAPIDLNEVAQAAAELAEPEALEAGVRLDVETAGPLPPVRSDRVLLEQVALNLVRNAIEAAQGLAAPRRRVTLATATRPDGSVAFSVADLGDGVTDEVRARLFEAFVTTKPAGLGLGLSICRSVIEAQGGALRHEPNAPTGARFEFTLPAAA